MRKLLIIIICSITSVAFFSPEEQSYVCDEIADLGGWTDNLSMSKVEFCKKYIISQIDAKTIHLQNTRNNKIVVNKIVQTSDKDSINWENI